MAEGTATRALSDFMKDWELEVEGAFANEGGQPAAVEDAKSTHQQMKTIIGESFEECRDRLKKEDEDFEKEDEEAFNERLKEMERKCFEEGDLCLQEIRATTLDAEMGPFATKRLDTIIKWLQKLRPSGSNAQEAPSGAMPGSSPETATRPAANAASSSRSTSDRDRSHSHSGHNRRRRSPAAEPGRKRGRSFREVVNEELKELEVEGTFEEVPVQDQDEEASEAECRAWWKKAEADAS